MESHVKNIQNKNSLKWDTMWHMSSFVYTLSVELKKRTLQK